jgi:hypothetical protein
VSRVALPSFAALSKIVPDFSKKSGFKIEVTQKSFLSFNEKKNQKDSNDF